MAKKARGKPLAFFVLRDGQTTFLKKKHVAEMNKLSELINWNGIRVRRRFFLLFRYVVKFFRLFPAIGKSLAPMVGQNQIGVALHAAVVQVSIAARAVGAFALYCGPHSVFVGRSRSMFSFVQKNRKALFGTIFAALLALTASPAMAQSGNYGSGNAGQGAAQGQGAADQGAAGQGAAGQGAAGQGAAGQGAQQPAKQDFDDQTLEKFASASVELGTIQDKYSEKLEGVQDREKAMNIQREMNEEMVQVVQDKGIDVQDYNAVANQMSADPELQSKVDKLVEEKKAE
ncbi:MAG: DUF4168 domain-containing protein [Desulfuromonadales bacterium]